jgi:Secretion system C-terminal sorting domain
MKSTKLFLLIVVTGLVFRNATAQTQLATNANINILTANAGIVNQGSVIELSVSIRNTGSNPIQPQRIRVTISVPDAIALPLATPLQTSLANNWSILTNGVVPGIIVICNNTDVIPAQTTRTSIIKISANAIGGPLTINGGLAFGNGSNCSALTGSLNGDNSGDNTSTTGITVEAPILPVSLSAFDAIVKNCQPFLSWTTASEINNDRFEIEESNTSSNWTSKGIILSKGNSTSKNNYTFIDKNININTGKILYRLKMIDKDGSFKYSSIIPVEINCNATNVNIYPNPVEDNKIYVSLKGIVGNGIATLLTTSGQTILKSNIKNGSNYLSVTNVANGIYILNVKDENGFDKNIKVSIKNK